MYTNGKVTQVLKDSGYVVCPPPHFTTDTVQGWVSLPAEKLGLFVYCN